MYEKENAFFMSYSFSFTKREIGCQIEHNSKTRNNNNNNNNRNKQDFKQKA